MTWTRRTHLARWHLGNGSHTAWIRSLPDTARAYLVQVLVAEGAPERSVTAFEAYRPGVTLREVGELIGGLSTTRTTQLMAQGVRVLARAHIAWNWGAGGRQGPGSVPCVVGEMRRVMER